MQSLSQIEIGRTDSGDMFSVDIFGLPGILVGGATGQGKSVALHAIQEGKAHLEYWGHRHIVPSEAYPSAGWGNFHDAD